MATKKGAVGFCHICKKSGLERSAVCTIEKKHYCSIHITEIALDYYARFHLKLTKQKDIDDFKNTVIVDFVSMVKWSFDEKFKEDVGFL